MAETQSADPYTAKAKDEVPLKQKVEELGNLMTSCKFAMMTTRVESTGLMTSRAMSLAATESNGIDLLFHTNAFSGKTDALATDPSINIAFIDSSGQWASVAGTAEVSTDPELIKQHYSAALRAWLGDLGDGLHDGGPEDPRIGIIRVRSKSITYSVTGKTFIGRTADIAKGVITGETPAFMRLRDIDVEECEKLRKDDKAGLEAEAAYLTR